MKKYTVFSHGYASPLLRCGHRLSTELDFDQVKDTTIQFSEGDVLYVPSEDGLIWVSQRTRNTAIASAIELFKNKVAFRQACAHFTPNFFFREIAVQDMHLLDLDFSRSKRYIIKPKRGYYATAVRTISAHTNLRQLQIEMQAELAERSRYYPETMLSSQAMIVEEFIGQPIENSLGLDEAELAVDLFYDRNGEPVIVGLYHHPHPTCSAYFHTLYYTSQAIYARFSRMVIDFFESLQNQGLGLKNFPVHAEFKVIGARLIPIEINPYRFGGYGLADLLHHACGINPYETYFESRHPDWPSLWKGKSALYACVVGYNGEGVDLQIHEPQRAEFKAMFGSSLLHFGPLDHMNCPLFAMAYLETHEQDLLHEVLTLDYRKFFQAKPTITERAGTPC